MNLPTVEKSSAPPPGLRFLIVEDASLDADLVQAELRAGGLAFSSQIVKTEPAYRAALRDFAPDLILCDSNLHSFAGQAALAIALETRAEAPFIVVSGTIGEEQAVELLRQGATDFVLKARLSRLVPVVNRALRDARHRFAARRAAAALRESEERYRQLVELSPDAIFIRSGMKIAFINSAGTRLLGAERPEQIIGKSILELVHPDSQEEMLQRIEQIEPGQTVSRLEQRFVRFDGMVVEAELVAAPFFYHGQPGVQLIARDITERKRAEREREQMEQRLRQTERMASFGQLAQKIVRELRQPSSPAPGGTASGAGGVGDLAALMRDYEKLIEAARQGPLTAGQLAEAAAARAQVSDQVVANLCTLVMTLTEHSKAAGATGARTEASEADEQDRLLTALQETVAVLKLTKRSFKSRALGDLRGRLEQLLEKRP